VPLRIATKTRVNVITLEAPPDNRRDFEIYAATKGAG
jgi:hypothetical protein